MLLQVENLHVSYGAIHAVQGISFDIQQGEIVALIGANGAGKSTTLRTISGLLRPTEGDIIYQGNSIIKTSPEKIVKMGISQVPEGRQIFSDL
ncbi:MAG: ATP-binding cassette domain-containing protein, partial [Anaerolineales bacterium]